MDAVRNERNKLMEMLGPQSEFDFAKAERRCRKGAHRLFGSLFADLCQGLDTPLPKHARCQHCKAGTLRSDGRRDKLVMTTMGGFPISRRRYRCDGENCREATYPLDWTLDLKRDRWSPELREAMLEVAQGLSFGPAAKLLGRLSGANISGRHLGRVAQQEGAAMERDRRRREPTPPTRVEPVMHASIDGTSAPMKPSQVEIQGAGEAARWGRGNFSGGGLAHPLKLPQVGHFKLP